MDYVKLGADAFKERVSNSGLTKVEVDGLPFPIYFKPQSIKTRASLDKYRENITIFSLRMMIARALTEDGANMFKPSQYTEIFNQWDNEVLENIATKMLGLDEGDTEEVAEKN